MQIDRKEFLQELELRKHIRKAITIVNKRRAGEASKQLHEELKLRKIIQDLIVETAVDEEDPKRTTGINELERVLEEIIKILEQDFKRLTTSEEQRASFRSHIIKGVQNLLATERTLEDQPKEEESELEPIATPPADDLEAGLEEQVDIEIEDEDEAFIDVRGEKEKPEKEEKSPEEDFGIEGEDETGRNFAYETFVRVEKQILKGYNRLGDPEDKDLYYDYLITNLKLYFDKFEDELKAGEISPEPTTPEYEEEKTSQGEFGGEGPPAGEEPIPGEEEELDLGALGL